MTELLVYGSYGYTGDLIVEKALAAGLEPILAGRRREPLREQATRHGLSYRTFDVTDATNHLESGSVVLHCAGPFIHTYEPMVEACLETGSDYLDVTGEIDVFEAIQAYDEAADAAEVMLLPGVGFDVVPSDCLAMSLYEALPTATHLSMAMDGLDTLSAGTARTVIEGLGDDSAVRAGGLLRSVPMGERTRRIDIDGTGESRLTMAIPWGDLSTAYYSTGIPNIEFFSPTTRGQLRALTVMNAISPLLGSKPVRTVLKRLVDATVDGPDEAERTSGTTVVWGEATDGSETVTGRVRTPETYEFTGRAALEIATRALNGDAPPGYQTPATAYGADLILDIPGCSRETVA